MAPAVGAVLLRFAAVAVVAAMATAPPCNAFYLPGLAPVQYDVGQPVPLRVGKLSSVKTQLPYDYYSQPLCRPPAAIFETKRLGLGEVLLGNRIHNSLHDIRMQINVPCAILCQQTLTAEEALGLRKLILEEYRAHWCVGLRAPMRAPPRVAVGRHRPARNAQDAGRPSGSGPVAGRRKGRPAVSAGVSTGQP